VALSLAGRKFELLFLDAEHDIDSVRRHIRLLRQLAATEAVFAFHDYHQPLHPAVRQAVNEAFPRLVRHLRGQPGRVAAPL
jgi:hypothetical protein